MGMAVGTPSKECQHPALWYSSTADVLLYERKGHPASRSGQLMVALYSVLSMMPVLE
jgi:hypothetical protein